MDWLKRLLGNEPKATAATAKERLLVVVQHQRAGRRGDAPNYLPQLREELLAVVRKYVQVADSAVDVQLRREDGDEVLAMSITLPDRVG